MKAMILCAGYGKRLHPLTLSTPKPLLKIGNETLLSNTLKFLEKFRIKKVIINVHYLSDQIFTYIKKNKFNMDIEVVYEEKEILDTGCGVLNAIQHFSNEAFIIINPDTIWNFNYLKELANLIEIFTSSENCNCSMLLVNKKKSFDKSFKGDFNLKNNLIDRNNKENLNYIYTGLQIVKPAIFLNSKNRVFSINKIWDKLITQKQLYGIESNNDFLHISKLEIYENILKNKLNIK